MFKFNCSLGNRYFWRCMLEHTKRQVHKWKFLQHALSRYVYNRSLFDIFACIRRGHIRVFIWSAAIILWSDFARGKSKPKEEHCASKGRAREMHWLLFCQKRSQWMASFVENARPVKTTLTKADFCNSREKQTQGLLLWSKIRYLAWGASKHNSDFLF